MALLTFSDGGYVSIPATVAGAEQIVQAGGWITLTDASAAPGDQEFRANVSHVTRIQPDGNTGE